jgi:hypothetical protein
MTVGHAMYRGVLGLGDGLERLPGMTALSPTGLATGLS